MKRLIYFILCIFCFSTLLNAANIQKETDTRGIFQSKAITGTTADTYPGTAQAEWVKATGVLSPIYCLKKTIIIHNTGGTNSLDYKIEVKYNTNMPFVNLVGETDIAVANSTAALIENTSNWESVNIFTRSTSAGLSTGFSIYVSCRR